jgi:hypothetical protein
MANRDSNMDSQSASNPTTTASTAQRLKDEALDLAGEAKAETSRVAGQAKDHVQGLVTQQKERVAGQLGSLAGALREAGQKLDEKDGDKGFGRYAGRAAEQVDRVSNYLRGHELTDVIRDAETFARRRPDVFLGGTFLAGLLLARFLKASGERQETDWDGTDRPRTSTSTSTYGRTAGLSSPAGTSYARTGETAYQAPQPYTPPVGG